MYPRGQAAQNSVDQGTFVWAHNPAAWIGIAICVVLLLTWLHYYTQVSKEDANEL